MTEREAEGESKIASLRDGVVGKAIYLKVREQKAEERVEGVMGRRELNEFSAGYMPGTVSHIFFLIKTLWGFPGGAVVENLPANAGDMGSSPGLGGSHMPRSSWARESQLLSLRIWSLCSATREAAIVRGPRSAMKSGPRLPQLEEALAQKRRPNTAINK